MAKKNNKSTVDTLNVVSSEPVNSIEETGDKSKDSKGVEDEMKDETDKTEIGETKTDAAETPENSENEEKSKESTEVSGKKEDTAKASDEKSEINATDSTAASSDDKKEATDKKEETDKKDDASSKIDKKQISETTSKGNGAEEDAPAPPPRPISPLTQIKQDLKDAFPNIEEKLITAVLIASQGNPDPAFNALLYISDPSVEAEIPEPAPPVPSKPVNTQKNTLTDDELLARKLQKEFELEDKRRREQHHDRERRRRRRQQSQPEDADDDSVDEFGQIKESFSQGFEEARSTLNGWVSGLAKKFQEPTDDAVQPRESQSQNPKLFGALGGSSFTKQSKKNTFDEDPRIISNDLHTQINLKDNDDDEQDAPSLPKRQGDQTNKEKSAQSDSYINSNKKWQPLNSDVPVNSDAFLVTDSEDEDTGVTSYDAKKTKQSS
mmetsp:Transcript_5154/g.5152  ORF Transcript_5154/g.5152 Transcript_5154/m.5152 type:complete len:437 (+) Transcript_5154:66-1376(+)